MCCCCSVAVWTARQTESETAALQIRKESGLNRLSRRRLRLPARRGREREEGGAPPLARAAHLGDLRRRGPDLRPPPRGPPPPRLPRRRRRGHRQRRHPSRCLERSTAGEGERGEERGGGGALRRCEGEEEKRRARMTGVRRSRGFWSL